MVERATGGPLSHPAPVASQSLAHACEHTNRGDELAAERRFVEASGEYTTAAAIGTSRRRARIA